MFPKKSRTDSNLDDAIKTALVRVMEADGTDRYDLQMQTLTSLYELKKMNSSKPVSGDTIALIVGNLAGIAMIISYEHAHVITSKALSFAGKLR